MAHFSYPQKVLFKHCDPAGIVFYPRFFEMINDAIEALFADLLRWPFEEIHQSGAVPTKGFEVEFKAPARHGDQLTLEITLTKLGRTSLALETLATAEGTPRFTAKQTLVHVGDTLRPMPWPEPIRQRLTSLLEPDT
jgi:4-hydroxybenzoyl-CoA thioesterase